MSKEELNKVLEEKFITPIHFSYEVEKIVLKEKIEAENREMKETGRMRRWTPISEDPLLRERLKKVMMAQIHT